jgi:DNA-binding response OmpR family regulator
MSEMRSALVVDDDPTILNLAHLVLSAEGFAVHTVKTAPDAMAQVLAVAFDLLLVDLTLDDVDGFALLDEIKELGLASGARVAVVTGRDDEASFARGRELGIDDYLVKPLDAADLQLLAQTTATGSPVHTFPDVGGAHRPRN